MIVDEADRDIEMVPDPFLEAGINIPEELPYKLEGSSPANFLGQKLHRNSVTSITRPMASHVTALQQFKKRNMRSSSVPTQDDRNNFVFVVESLNIKSNEIGCSDDLMML